MTIQAPPAVIAEGVLGKEALHTWNSALTLNDRESGLPLYRLDKITGLHDRADSSNISEPITGQDGELFYPSPTLGKTIVYEGTVLASTSWGMRAARTSLLSVFHANTVGAMIVAPPPTRGGVAWRYVARVLSCVCDDVQEAGLNSVPTPHQRTFLITLRQNIPIYLGTVNNVVNGTSSVVVTNAGNAHAFPRITVNHPGGDLTISNTTGSLSLTFLGLIAGVFVMDFTLRRAYVNGTDVTAALEDATSNWLDELTYGMGAGANTITQSGGTDLSVTWNDTVF